MFTDDDLRPISALQHLVFCERQCALIHLEGLWAENRLTVEGAQLHERVDEEQPTESRGDVRVARRLAIRSYRLGVSGYADVVEFRRMQTRTEQPEPPTAAPVPGWPGLWQPLPVEYKRGLPKPDRSDEVQLCAQALCLEEMLGITVLRGAFFYGGRRRRSEVIFDSALRGFTAEAACRLHALLDSRRTPAPVASSKCRNCSLLELCMPAVGGCRRSAKDYLARAFDDVVAD
jgi:CRISPR-associated exonuclease Cas4